MHIPENYLSPATCLAMGTVMTGFLAVSVRKTSCMDSSRLSTLGMAAAFSFLVMMFNLPLPGGTTGHAVGAVLGAVLLGPWAASLALSIALLIQAVFFGDGGILALGANAFTMAFIMPFSGWFIFQALSRILKGSKGTLVSLGVASWAGVNLAALATAVLLGIQPLLARDSGGQALYNPYPLEISVPAVMIPHLVLVGFVEAAFTIAVFSFLRKTAGGMLPYTPAAAGLPDPALPTGSKMSPKDKEGRPVMMLLGLLALASPLGLLAAGTAWGEWAPEELPGLDAGGMMVTAIPQGMKEGWNFQAPFNGYSLGSLPEGLGYVLSALAGAGLLVVLFRLLAALRPRRKNDGT